MKKRKLCKECGKPIIQPKKIAVVDCKDCGKMHYITRVHMHDGLCIECSRKYK